MEGEGGRRGRGGETYIAILHAHHVDLDAIVAIRERADGGVSWRSIERVSKAHLAAVSWPVTFFHIARISIQLSPFSFMLTIILSAWSASSHDVGMPRGAASSFLGA